MSFASIVRRLDAYEKLLRLDKPVGIYLLLWPTLWGVVLAQRWMPFNGLIIWVFVLGTVFMRSAGCAINDYADRKFDGHVARTQNRPLVSGVIQPWEALVLAATLSVVSLLMILRFNSLTVYLSIPAVLLAGSYPFTKRFLAIPQAYLGLAFSFGIPMAYAAVWGRVPAVAWVLVACNLFWTIAYDTMYAMVDREDDLKIGIKTSAITFGRFDVAAIALCYVLSLGGLVAIGFWQKFGLSYFLACALAATIAIYLLNQIKNRDPARCFRAFLDNHWIGLVILLGLIVDHYLTPIRTWFNH